MRAFVRKVLVLVTTLGLGACGTLVFDHTPAALAPDPDGGNLLDPNTSLLTSSLGNWNVWYATQLTRGTDGGHVGDTCLSVKIGGADWGVGLSNWPGFTAAPGTYFARFWARAPSATDLTPSLNVTWNDSAGNPLRVDTLTTPFLTPEWQPTAQTLTAPAGTTTVGLTIVGTTGTAGEVVELDDFFVGPR
jgi:hypothetical protein